MAKEHVDRTRMVDKRSGPKPEATDDQIRRESRGRRQTAVKASCHSTGRFRHQPQLNQATTSAMTTGAALQAKRTISMSITGWWPAAELIRRSIW